MTKEELLALIPFFLRHRHPSISDYNLKRKISILKDFIDYICEKEKRNEILRRAESPERSRRTEDKALRGLDTDRADKCETAKR